jgi:2,4-dienoyl-CoA reductase-like NADH-dependent reductase (Old Yellow Enzyme family)
MGDSNKPATFGYVAREVGKRGIAFICVRESLEEPRLGPQLKRIFGGPYIANELFTKETGEKIVGDGEADAIAYGVLFIANPDLPRRLALNAPLNEPIQQTFYATGPTGYTDYPALDVEQKAA